MSESIPNEEDLLRKALFVPCQSKEDLHRWIQIYLGLNFPDTIVDPESNSSPMDMIWEIYHKGISNDDSTFSRVMAYACRDGFKTLGAAVLEVLGVLHMGRDVAHMAAIFGQAKKAQSYVKKAFRYPYLRDYVVSQNTELTEIVWYSNDDTGDCITKAQFEALLESEKLKYSEHDHYIAIVICTLAGANSQHVPLFVVDEIDVVPKQNQAAYEEAKSIPAPRDGKEPITLLTSTRKFAFGNVQRELDMADKTGLQVRHWNVIDVTERCPPERHLPSEPKIPIYYNRLDFSAISEKDFAALDAQDQKKYEKDEGYAGCLKKCKLFAMCRGKLATNQKEHPRDKKGEFTEKPMPLLRTIRFTTNKFRELSLDMAKAQLMCWQASQEGLIYPLLSRDKHLISPTRAVTYLNGEAPIADIDHQQLISAMLARDGRWYAGIDFGFTHNFAVVLVYVDGFRAFVVGSWTQPELDPTEKLELLDRTVKSFSPAIYADTEAPDMIKFLKKHGYRCKDWKKIGGSVLGGIEKVRYKLTPTLSGEPQLFFVSTGPGVKDLFENLALYHWSLDGAGKPSDVPDEVIRKGENSEDVMDDSADALRYAIMNIFRDKGKVTAPEDRILTPSPAQVKTVQEQNRDIQASWAKQIMEHAMGVGSSELEPNQEEQSEGSVQKKGGIYWDMS